MEWNHWTRIDLSLSVSGIDKNTRNAVDSTKKEESESSGGKGGRSRSTKSNSSSKDEDMVILKPEDKFRKVRIPHCCKISTWKM